MDNESKIIRFVHYTARGFFDQRRLEYFPNADIELTDVCLTYLTFDRVQGDHPEISPLALTYPVPLLHGDYNISKQNSAFVERKKRYIFLHYAACNWGHHAKGRPEEVLQDKILAFLQNNRALSSSLRVQFTYEGLGFHLHRPLHVAVSFELAKIVQLLLQTPSIELESEDEVHRTALVWAIRYRKVDMAVVLIQNGFDLGRVIRYGGKDFTVLSLAIRSGYSDLVSRILASASAPPIHPKDIYYAILLGPLIVVETYIKSVPDAAGKRKRCNEILHRTAEVGSPQLTPAVFECAMTHGGDPEALDDDECPILLKAVKFGNSEAVRLLLNIGASALIRTADGQSLLQMATLTNEVFRQRIEHCSGYGLPHMFLPDELPKLRADALQKAWGRCFEPFKYTDFLSNVMFSKVHQEEEDQRSIIRQLLRPIQQQLNTGDVVATIVGRTNPI